MWNMWGCRVNIRMARGMNKKLEEFDQVFWGDFGLTKDGTERAPVDLSMVRYNRLREWVVSPHDNVAAVLSPDCKSKLFEGTDDLGT
jgi:hypothetical protein